MAAPTEREWPRRYLIDWRGGMPCTLGPYDTDDGRRAAYWELQAERRQLCTLDVWRDACRGDSVERCFSQQMAMTCESRCCKRCMAASSAY